MARFLRRLLARVHALCLRREATLVRLLGLAIKDRGTDRERERDRDGVMG